MADHSEAQVVDFIGLTGLAPRAGLEPATLRLTAGCSAIELPRNAEWVRLTRTRRTRNLTIVAKSRHSTHPTRQNRGMKYGIPLLLLTIGIPLAAQEERPVPKDSARVSIPGCSKGSAFVVTESPEGERTSVEIKTGRRFRLTGKKDLLNEIKAREG